MTTSIPAEASRLLHLGFAVTPVHPGSKRPVFQDWPNRGIEPGEIDSAFGGQRNLGVVLGMNGIVDIDLDSREARCLASLILPPTDLVFGRAGAPGSHWLYTCKPLPQSLQLTDPETDHGGMLCELRSAGHMTVFPPSVHPSGESYEYERTGLPESVEPEILADCLEILAALVLVVRTWPAKSMRHRAALALGGVLARRGYDELEAENIGAAVANLAGDDEVEDRGRAVRDSARKHRPGERTTGLPTLLDALQGTGRQRELLARLLSGNQDERRAPTAKSRSGRSQETLNPPKLDVVVLRDVQAVPVEFVWPPYLPKGKLAIVEGDPGLGKSTLCAAIAASISRGVVPGSTDRCEPGRALLLTAEDDLEDTVRPRLEALGADLDNVFAVRGVLTGEGTSLLTLDSAGLASLDAEIERIQPTITFVDPLVAYLGGRVDIHRANEVREVTAALAAMASRHRCSILGVRHLTKSGVLNPAYRGLGSIDFYAAARSVLLVGRDPDDSDRLVLVHSKCNVAALGPSLAFSIHDGVFGWEGQVDLTAKQILGGESTGRTSAVDTATAFLLDALAAGARRQSELVQDAASKGIATRTLDRAKANLGVRSHRHTQVGGQGNGYWTWELPGTGMAGAR